MGTDFTSGRTTCVQQVLTGTGAFTGAMLGYASYSYTAVGGATIRARALGPAGGSPPKIQFVNLTTVTACPLSVRVEGANTIVVLARAASAITSKLSDIAAAINAFVDPQGRPAPVQMGVTTDATVTAALALTSLAGGMTPAQSGGFIRFDPATNTPGGLFYFEQTSPIAVRTVEANLTTNSIAVAVKKVNLTQGLTEIAGESATLYSSASLNPAQFTLNDYFVLMPYQGLIVTAPSAGMVRVYAERI